MYDKKIGDERIKDLDHARSIISNLQRRENKYFHEAMVAKARIYDLQHYGQPEPAEAEMKAQIVGLQDECKKNQKQRDHYKKKYYDAAGIKKEDSVNDIALDSGEAGKE